MFDNLIESSGKGGGGRTSGAFMVSFVVHAVVLTTMLVVPLIYYQVLPQDQLLTFLVAPPPPAPPPPPPPPPSTPPPVRKVQIVKLDPSQFMAPTEVPDEIPPPSDDIPTLSTFVGGGAVPGGVMGGVPGGVLGGVIGGVPSAAPPPPPPRKKRAPIRVGGNVQSSKLVQRVEPRYPELAKRARVQGLVLLQVTVGELGTVTDIRVIRGHPLLTEAALSAVRQWIYSPTLLNGEPVPVLATVTVNFVLR